MKKHYRAENDCLNCGATLQGKFCHVCGQENLQIKESFGHMMNHAISDYFHFDQQFFNTLKPLLFKPGKLTNEYMAGKRASYLHPVKMYIFISFIYFVLLFSDKIQSIQSKSAQAHNTELATKADSIVAKNPGLSAEQKNKIYTTYNYSVKKSKDGKGNDTTYHNLQALTRNLQDTSYEQYMLRQSQLPAAERDGFIARYAEKKALKIKNQETGSTLLEAFYHDVPKAMFLLLPIFALILKISFRKNKKFYVEHLIYSFHLHCFVFLLFVFIMLIGLIAPVTWDYLNLVGFALIAWYFYRSLRVVYNRSSWRTVSKMIGIAISYFAALVICMSLLFIIVAIIEI